METAQPKASKAEKREQQRAANVMRAEKMHKARLAYPPALLLDERELPLVNVGCSGWFYWDWKGMFYPEGMPTSAWFKHYMSAFGTVELNAPFYGWPTMGTVQRWRREVEGTGFVYTVKVNELITHIKRFEGVAELVKDFGLIADVLGPHFGCFLYQFPASFEYSAKRLRNIVTQVETGRRNVVEFRHASWWNDKVYEAFEKAGIVFCACSAPKLPEDMVRTADEVYVRFHGPKTWYRHDYTDMELDVWADKIKASGAKRVWVYFNNDYDGYAIKNGLVLRGMLTEGTRVDTVAA